MVMYGKVHSVHFSVLLGESKHAVIESNLGGARGKCFKSALSVLLVIKSSSGGRAIRGVVIMWFV